jgi:hypothetical protein
MLRPNLGTFYLRYQTSPIQSQHGQVYLLWCLKIQIELKRMDEVVATLQLMGKKVAQ